MSDASSAQPSEAPSVAEAGGQKPWPRAAFMIAFAVMIAIAQNLLLLIAVLQFLWIALAGGPNARIAAFSRSLGVWLRDAAAYQGAATEDRPFPWADWPASHG
jgi:hypothetical protein